MGYENRDYARDDRGGWGYSGGGGSFKDWPIWKKIIAINIAVFLLQIFFTRPVTIEEIVGNQGENIAADELVEQGLGYEGELPRVSVVQEWLELDSQKVIGGQIWRLITCGFCHDRQAIFHILFNMLFLFWFGSRLEERYGSREFAVFYFVALLTASFAYIALDLYTATLVPAIGASGAVWGVVALYALLYPYDTIRIYFLFPVQIWFMALIYFLFDLHPVLLALSGEAVHSGVGHAAHVGGAIFGYLYWQNNWQLSPFLDKFIGRRPRWANSGGQPSRARVVPMHGPYKKFEPTEDDQMDSILEKISSQGRDSLTAEEEEFLLKASEKIRNR